MPGRAGRISRKHDGDGGDEQNEDARRPVLQCGKGAKNEGHDEAFSRFLFPKVSGQSGSSSGMVEWNAGKCGYYFL